eukprot:CAMPEP_0201890856 /NCGR_PEP_ID=MMETSP0902-20130614/33125_1 /ASSEMBLY_ACC=CAM_ASM_000551 /TAXON_ID=420261 /ORGANISM="Thalassiosira antarctica, Strain CCMP982" /LENGTH=225 /DNA_ID=CAMNT_0048421839 /DNA_START=58 /DNA_END=731 /DNA_ORIENTATION=-
MYDTITKDAEPANYGSSVSPPSDENMNLLQKQADEATAVAKDAKRTSLLSASIIIGFAVLLVIGSALSSSSTTPKVSLLGSGYSDMDITEYDLEGWILKAEIEAFCKFESSDISAPDFLSQPCAHCYVLAAIGNVDYDEEGQEDFAQCYWNQIIATGGVPSPKDYKLKAYDENDQFCDGWVVMWYGDMFTHRKFDDNDPQFDDVGFTDDMSRILNYYYQMLAKYP